MSEVKISGAYLRNSIAALRAELGEDRFHMLQTKCPPKSAALLQRTLQSDEWVEPDTWYAIHDVLLREVYGGDHARLTALARKSADRLFTAWQKRLLGWLGPRLAVKLVVKKWVAAMEHATATVEASSRREIVIRLAGTPRNPAFVHVLRGYIELLMSCTSARDVRTSIVDVSAGSFTLVISFS